MKVPQYESDIKEKQLGTSLINAVGSAASFGGGSGNIAAAVAETGGTLAKVYQVERKKADDTLVDEKMAEAVKKETELVYDQNGALNKKGKSAFGEVENVNTEFGKFITDTEKQFTNDYQKEQWRKKMLDMSVGIDRTVRRHVGTEIISYDNSVATNLVKNEMDAAVKAYDDPERVGISLARQAEAIERISTNNGWSDEEKQAKINDAAGKTHKNVIERYLVNDRDMDAQKYFEAIKDTVTGDDLTVMEKQIEAGSLRGNSQRITDGFLNSRISESSAIEQAKKIEDPKLRDAVYDRIKMEFNMKDSAQRADVEKLHTSALNLIDNGRATDLTRIPGWPTMTENQRSSLISYAKAKTSGKNIQTDYNTYYNLKTMASTPGMQDKFLKTNLMEYRDKLDNGDFEKVIDIQTKLRKGDGSVKKTLDGFRSDQQVVKQGYEAAGLKSTDKEKFNEFNGRIESIQIAEQERLGRKLNNKEMAEIVKDQAKEVVLKEGWLWDDKKKMFELSDDEVKTIKYKDVPSADKINIEKALKSKGKQVSEEAVRQLYIKRVLNGRG